VTVPADAGAVTALLAALRGGDPSAADRLLPLIYGDLRLAAARLLARERPGHTLPPTALVHEAWLKLAASPVVSVHDRAHFLSVAARAMRQVLVEHARRRLASKRGSGVVAVTLEDAQVATVTSPEELLALDDALERLGEVDERLRQVVELRFFGGLTEDEIAEVLGMTTRTVQRDWAKARAWLYRAVYEAPA